MDSPPPNSEAKTAASEHSILVPAYDLPGWGTTTREKEEIIPKRRFADETKRKQKSPKSKTSQSLSHTMVRISTWIRSVSLFVKALVSAGTIVFFMENLDYKRFSVVCCGFCEVFGIFFCLWAAVNRWKRINGILVVLWSAFLFWEIVNVVLLSKKDRSDLFVSIASTVVILVMVGWNYFDKKNRIQSWPSRDTISNYFDQSKSSLSLQIEPEESQVHQSKEGQDAIVILSFTRKKENEISVSQFQKVRILKQHKSKTLVETTAGQIGFVPTVILK